VHIGIKAACTVTDHAVHRTHVSVTADHLSYQVGKDMGQTVEDPKEEGRDHKPFAKKMHHISYLSSP
jgi:hypothetical protein